MLSNSAQHQPQSYYLSFRLCSSWLTYRYVTHPGILPTDNAIAETPPMRARQRPSVCSGVCVTTARANGDRRTSKQRAFCVTAALLLQKMSAGSHCCCSCPVPRVTTQRGQADRISKPRRPGRCVYKGRGRAHSTRSVRLGSLLSCCHSRLSKSRLFPLECSISASHTLLLLVLYTRQPGREKSWKRKDRLFRVSFSPFPFSFLSPF